MAGRERDGEKRPGTSKSLTTFFSTEKASKVRRMGQTVEEGTEDATPTRNDTSEIPAFPAWETEIRTGLRDPYQPDPALIPVKTTTKQSYRFQKKWYTEFPWIRYVPELSGVVCIACVKARIVGRLDLAKCADPAFLQTGLSNWKRGAAAFLSHQKTNTHFFAVNSKQATPVLESMSEGLRKEQAKARKGLLCALWNIQTMLRQGLAFRKIDESEGNFMQFMFQDARVDETIQAFLNRQTNLLSWYGQEEMINLISRAVLTQVLRSIRKNDYFSIMVDGTQDITNQEQEAFCFRHVDSDLNVFEDFVGLYNPPGTSGDILAKCIKDVLVRLELPIEQLRGQAYDGASNMSGEYNGCQALIRELQPLAMYFHCAPHCANLVMQKAVSDYPLIRDSMQWVHEVGVLFSRSGKSDALFKQMCADLGDPVGRSGSIRPLCPTRFLLRGGTIRAAIRRYDAILQTIEEISQRGTTPEQCAKASGLMECLRKAETLLALKMILPTITKLEDLNRSLQSRDATIEGMLDSVDIILRELRVATSNLRAACSRKRSTWKRLADILN